MVHEPPHTGRAGEFLGGGGKLGNTEKKWVPPWPLRQQARLQKELPRGAVPSDPRPESPLRASPTPWGRSPASPVEKTLLDTVTLSSGTFAQSPVARQPFMGKLMSVALLAGSLWMLRTWGWGAGKRWTDTDKGRQRDSGHPTRGLGPGEPESGPGSPAPPRRGAHGSEGTGATWQAAAWHRPPSLGVRPLALSLHRLPGSAVSPEPKTVLGRGQGGGSRRELGVVRAPESWPGPEEPNPEGLACLPGPFQPWKDRPAPAGAPVLVRSPACTRAPRPQKVSKVSSALRSVATEGSTESSVHLGGLPTPGTLQPSSPLPPPRLCKRGEKGPTTGLRDIKGDDRPRNLPPNSPWGAGQPPEDPQPHLGPRPSGSAPLHPRHTVPPNSLGQSGRHRPGRTA